MDAQRMTQIGLYPVSLTKPFELSLSAIKSVLEPENPSYSKRVPNCQKCGQHGRKSRLKGHKRVCPFRDCKCVKCAVVTERQKLMADQIKIRRRQRKDTLMNLTREHITTTINAAAALSATPFNISNLNAILYNSIKSSPQPILSSPTSSDGSSSYSPSLQFPSPSLPIILPPSPPESHSPQSAITTATAASTTTTTSTPASTPIIAPVPINPASFPFLGLASTENVALLESLLAQYKILEEMSSSPKVDDEKDENAMNSNVIIDVCSV
ncbi:unnamed protein product [Caenorhabditis bovis]|uniref:DM domain-containing protein n=1 Tax=Caenorhabditis bovis TaxID=2654633 RepID=A0A8S1E8Z9_9PELO|nr:unnamed protein product [Caenorhabditis bovis]